jgi:hypothetical protein
MCGWMQRLKVARRNMNHTKLHFAAAVLPLLFLTPFATARDSAATPEQLIHKLAAAAKNGDTDAFLSHLTIESRKATEESLENQAALLRSRENLRRALTETFGEGRKKSTPPPGDFKSQLMRIDSFELLSAKPGPDGTLQLRIKTSLRIPAAQAGEKIAVHEDTFVARKQEDAWKLELNPGPSRAIVAEKAALDRVAAAVRRGEFRDGRSALLELGRICSMELPSNVERGVALESKNPENKSQPVGAVAASGRSSTAVPVPSHKIHVQPY